jgi:hypothetical protein
MQGKWYICGNEDPDGDNKLGEREGYMKKKTEETDPWNTIDGEGGILDDSHTSRKC